MLWIWREWIICSASCASALKMQLFATLQWRTLVCSTRCCCCVLRRGVVRGGETLWRDWYWMLLVVGGVVYISIIIYSQIVIYLLDIAVGVAAVGVVVALHWDWKALSMWHILIIIIVRPSCTHKSFSINAIITIL